jgi:hypothetical protein
VVEALSPRVSCETAREPLDKRQHLGREARPTVAAVSTEQAASFAILCRPQVESESSRSLRELGVFGHELGTTEPSARPIQLGLESFHRDCKVEHRRGSDQGGLIRAAAGFVV